MNKNVIDAHIEELKETWGYETEELNDFRERLLDVFESGFWEGKEYRKDEYTYSGYGKQEDFE
jgi:hypothetical protein